MVIRFYLKEAILIREITSDLVLILMMIIVDKTYKKENYTGWKYLPETEEVLVI